MPVEEALCTYMVQKLGYNCGEGNGAMLHHSITVTAALQAEICGAVLMLLTLPEPEPEPET